MPKKKTQDEGLKSPGVIVTHPENHVTPRNSQTLWLVVMMALIGFVGGIATIVMWQRDEIAWQFDRMHLGDSRNSYSMMSKRFAEKNGQTEQIPCSPDGEWRVWDSVVRLSLPPCWQMMSVRSGESSFVLLSRNPFEFEASATKFNDLASLSKGSQVLMEFVYPDVSLTFEEFVKQRAEDGSEMKLVSGFVGVNRVGYAPTDIGIGAYFFDITALSDIDASPYPLFAKIELLDNNNYAVPNTEGDYYKGQVVDITRLFEEIARKVKWQL